MAYEICKICGRFFEKCGRELCDKCYDKDKKEYATVIEYVKTHKGAQAIEIINATKVPMKTIMRYVEQGSLSYYNEKVEVSENTTIDQKSESDLPINKKSESRSSRRR